jgi:co-chaperonin GroES (HSP10)
MLRPLHDWVVVELDPLPNKVGSLFIPDNGSGAERVRTGTIVDTGPGKCTKKGKRIPLGVAKGEKVAFFRENLEHQQGKQIQRLMNEFEDGKGLIRSSDILYVVE